MNKDNLSAASASFPIVGIGASAGGLTALEQFLLHVPHHCGLAIVLVQHRDPHSEGMLVVLLQRHTPMPVQQVADQMPVEPDHVHVIPPGSDMSLMHGVLHLFEPTEARGLRQPIDFFFKSLADDRQHNSIGVILSGMGSDGTLGLQAGGATFAQTPASAQFDSMPRSAIDADVVDAVAPAEELPAKVIAFVKRIRLVGDVQAQIEAAFQRTAAGFLDKILVLLRTHTGHDFSAYKKNTIMRRVERRKGLHQLSRIDDYLRYVGENPKEVELLLGELLIGVTSFFRDPQVWEQVKREVLPTLRANYPDGATLRAWILGCSTGEEAYSLAMMLRESLDTIDTAQRYKLLIFASDLDKDAISRARAGVYPPGITADVSEARLKRFFVPEGAGYRVSNDMRNLLDSTEIAILFLDESLHVRRFTPSTSKIFKLIPGDAGRSITDIVCDLDYPSLGPDALEVLRTLVIKETDVLAAVGRWFKVRIMPYRTQDNRIDGLAITFVDISASKRLEAELRDAQSRLQALASGPNSRKAGHGVP